VLTTYGEPDEILVHSYKSEPKDYPDFRLALLYTTKGFIVQYGTGERESRYEGDDNVGCLGIQPSLYLYTPNIVLTHDELYDEIFGFYIPGMTAGDIVRPVEEATGMSKHDFYLYYQ
jgi:hypothetical protein